MPAALNDKAIHSAKQAGAQLFADMDPLLRKDKLEEMVRKLDDQLILEMQNKESLEQQLAVLETEQLSAETGRTSPSSSPQHWAAPSSSANRSKEVKALHQRLDKSGEKVDALRLLMLQYCSGLQNCINSLEIEDGEGRSVDPDGNGSGSPANGTSNSPSPPSVVSESAATAANFSDDTDSPKTERKRSAFGGMSQGVGGFVRRASSSVKEKMSSFKEFGRKTTSKAATPGRALDQPESSQEMLQIVTTSERNNSGLNPIVEIGEPAQVPTLQRNARSKSDGQVENFVRLAETPSLKSSSTLEINNPAVSSLLEGPHLVNNGSRDTNDVPHDTRRASKYPEVEIHVENADSSNSHAERERPRKRKVKSDEPKHLLREALEDGHQILRSRSDSNLDLTMDASRLSPGAGAGRKHGPGRGTHKKTDPIRGSNQLSPKHILAYRGSSSSLPQLVAHDDSDSDCSDYVVIDTSEDEARHSDSTSEYDYDDDDGELDAVTDVTFEGDPRVVAPGSGVDVEDEEGTPDHRAIIQHLHTYQV
ncbi:hypothetical protein EGW08_003923 [Elysia chlorotica]|uniref:Uncharacterized protein n=1 Tax=Elysia chlorotica TaxID=188477 RepID=A0A433U3A2_ELYCH|nr:hypothetical protein EGW08_003923 [Elysia chlorotica]